MSNTNFAASLAFTLAYEGGYVDNPADPGGATYQGVTQTVYDDYRTLQHVPLRSVRLMEAAERDAIYRSRYWDRIQGDSLVPGVDYAMFDFAVNSGVARSVKELQGVLKLKEDGLIGPGTLAAVRDYVVQKGPAPLIFAICDARVAFMRSLSAFATFGKGWLARVDGAQAGAQTGDTGVRDRAFRMAMEQPVPTLAGVVATAKTYQGSA